MNPTLDAEVNADEAARIQNEIDRLFGEMDLAHERMKKVHDEIEQSKLQTRAMLTELRQLQAERQISQ